MGALRKAFEVRVGNKVLDYRVGATLELDKIRRHFEKRFTVVRLVNGGRHVLGELEKDGKEYFLKLATTEGISAVTRNEYRWNEVFAAAFPRAKTRFWVPMNMEEGTYDKCLYYFITDMLRGEHLSSGPHTGMLHTDFPAVIPDVITLSENIQDMVTGEEDTEDHQELFLRKTHAWFDAIPVDVRMRYSISRLLDIVTAGAPNLAKKPRHGDFTPWHLLLLGDGKLGLIDGEHYLSSGVAGYDISYFLQRLFTICGQRSYAQSMYNDLMKRGYSSDLLRVTLAARAIGGYLDASFAQTPSYKEEAAFHSWVEGM